jgi:hypothetical protein
MNVDELCSISYCEVALSLGDEEDKKGTSYIVPVKREKEKNDLL